jgi:cobaltochelatase CobT
MGWTDRGRKWSANRAQLRRFDFTQKSPGEIADRLSRAVPDSEDLAICLLIDQSGSMLGAPIAATASAVRVLGEALADRAIPTEILGFSTVGWQGGFARRDWMEQGSPERPGRLCALLHVIYKDAGTTRWDETSRDAFLNPDTLRENVDGEAIEWAASRLFALPQSRKILIVLSDGAPVDDATRTENGPSYLWRHLRATIARLERSESLRLGGIGIGTDYRVDELYRHSREAELGSIADATIELIGELARPR